MMRNGRGLLGGGRGFLFIRETTIVVFCFDIDKDYADLVFKQKSVKIICFLIYFKKRYFLRSRYLNIHLPQNYSITTPF